MSAHAQLELQFETIVVPRGDGSFLVKPGRLQTRTAEISADEAAAILGRSAFTVYRYVREGLLTAKQAKPRARLRLDRAEVEALAARTTLE